MASPGVMGWTDSRASRALPVMASGAPQGTRATQATQAPRAAQETWAPQGSACPALKASVASPEMPAYLDRQASLGHQASREPQDK